MVMYLRQYCISVILRRYSILPGTSCLPFISLIFENCAFLDSKKYTFTPYSKTHGPNDRFLWGNGSKTARLPDTPSPLMLTLIPKNGYRG